MPRGICKSCGDIFDDGNFTDECQECADARKPQTFDLTKELNDGTNNVSK